MTTKINYKGYMIEIEQDDCDEYNNPRLWDNLGTMICHHGRYSLGDEQSLTVEQTKKKVTQKDIISLPLYLYDHSGITMRTHPFEWRWDSGQVGYIIVDYKKVRTELGVKRITKSVRKAVLYALTKEVDIYDMFITGDVQRLNIIDCNNVRVDGCSGYFGCTEEEITEDGKATIDHMTKTPSK